MDRYSNSTDFPDDSPPSEAWLFAKVVLGRPIPRIVPPEVKAKARREELERLAPLSERHAQELRKLQADEADARRDRELLEWAAGISTRAEDQLRALQRKEAEQREAGHRIEQLYESYSASVTEWNEADHPRAPKGTSIGGQWIEKGGGGGGISTGKGRSPSGKGPSSSGNDEPDEPNQHMLDVAHAWWQTKGALEQARRDIEDLPRRIASERAQLGSGGRYAYIHSQNLAKSQRDLENAKTLAPELEKQLNDLWQEYHDAGYDEIPYSTFTPAETIVGGKGVEEVGRAVARGGTPTGLQPTGIEFEIASAVLAGPAILRLGKAVLGKAALRKAATTSIPKLPAYTTGGKTTGVLRTTSGDVPLISGRAGPASSLAKPTPGFNAVTMTHVEGHAAALMRQQGIKEATIYINNPKICLPCQQNLANMLPSGSKLTVVLPDGTAKTFIGNAR